MITGYNPLVEIVGHRGIAGLAPENTLASFREAVRLGASWLEFDVRFTKDGFPVIIHDASLKRTTSGRGPVREKTLAEIRRLDAGSWYQPRFAAEKVPTLDEVLRLGGKVRLNIEIKARTAPPAHAAEAVWSRVRAEGMEQRTLITSFDVAILKALRSIAPHAALGLPWESGLRDPIRRAVTLGSRMMLLEVGALSEKRVRRCRDAGLEVWVYTVNDPDDMRRVMDLGIDALITDRPDILAGMLRRAAV